MNFIKNDRTYSKYYDEFIVLLGTGMRVSEFCGLTKTECGRRFIPMTNDVYNKLFPKRPLPNITPHVFRHTFCTNMVNYGMVVKVLQYIMGHSEIDVTFNIYTHMSYDRAASQMLRLVDGTLEESKVSFAGA